MQEDEYSTARLDNLDRSSWTSLKLFAQLAGRWWFSVWLLVLISGLVAFGLTATNTRNFPTPVWAGLLLTGLVLAPAVAFHHLRIDRDRFRLLWEDKATVAKTLTDLEALRADGAALQIRGRGVAKKESIEAWAIEANSWYERVLAKLGELHPAEAGKFRTLGIYTPRPVAGPEPLTARHGKLLQNLVRRLEILSEITDRWIR